MDAAERAKSYAFQMDMRNNANGQSEHLLAMANWEKQVRSDSYLCLVPESRDADALRVERKLIGM